jgi:redox-sensitive bicupin YhaK (pirin superfamily)
MKPDAVIRVQPLGFPWQTLDPFLFCVHHDDAYPAGNEALGPRASLEGRDLGQDFEGKDGWRMYHGQTVPGFPQHPHRGFETVTIVREGYIDHSDSLGATARFGQGDVQWLTAGKGVVHCEMFPLVNRDAPNPLELFQIWLNLPAANKLVDPHFSMLWGPKIPARRVADAQGRATDLKIIAGSYDGLAPLAPPPKSWASNENSNLAIWTIRMDAGARWTLPPTLPGTNRMLYFFTGASLKLDGREVKVGNAIQVSPEAAIELTNGGAEGELLLLQGRPIGEPVASYGPFVMNTQREIQQAFADYQRTQFGGWPWKRDDPVHPREAKRFAKHVDGHLEEP